MRLNGPISQLFKLRVANSDRPIAAGLCLTATVEFTAGNEGNASDRLVLVTDHGTKDIPLHAFFPACSLQMDSLVDFGSMAADSQLINKEVVLTNNGSAPGSFQILYRGDTPLSITPTSGVLAPKSTQLVRVELCTDQPRLVSEEAEVKLQDSDDVVLRIRGEVLEQHLELLDTSRKEKLSCLQFGSAYFGTCRLQKVVLENRGPKTCNWVAVLQDDAVGTEAGTDLLASTHAALLERNGNGDANAGASRDSSAVVACVPSEGRLRPNKRITLAVCFSPGGSGAWDKRSSTHAAERDFSLFMTFSIVGSTPPCNGSVELAITGSGLPLSLTISPSSHCNFKRCMLGESADVKLVLQNHSSVLPVPFKFRNIANFSAEPTGGRISPEQCQDVVLTFKPRQIGKFSVQFFMSVLGQVAKMDSSMARLHFRNFHHEILHMSAVCRATSFRAPSDLGPAEPNPPPPPTGPVASAGTAAQLEGACSGEPERRAGAVRKTRPRGRTPDQRRGDSAAAARPRSPAARCRAGAEPYRHVDPDCAFTVEEALERKQHKDCYRLFSRNQRQQRSTDGSQGELQDDVNIGMRPAAGLLSPRLSLRDVDLGQSGDGSFARQSCLLTTRTLAAVETRLVTEGRNAVPSTAEELADCSNTLTIQQLHQVVIGPSVVDFGEVCANSTSVQQLELANSLPAHVWAQVEVGCPELQRSSPLSHVLAPLSRTELRLVFESDILGPFSRSVSYTLNGRHSGRVLVQARVVSVALELSADELVLSPVHSLLSQSGYRRSVTLFNRRNHPAQFTWTPIVTESGIAFSIRPATGTVEAHQELDCEVVWHPSYYSPHQGSFELAVHEGNTAELKCVAEVESPCIQLAEKHLLFGTVPLNVTSVRTAVLRNTGHNHAYFQVFDAQPLPGMVVTPTEGVVPVGGRADIQLRFTPGAVVKFDTRVEVRRFDRRSLWQQYHLYRCAELKVPGAEGRGCVEAPRVEINPTSFRFHGVYTGSTRAIPFSLQNHSETRTCVRFDLSEHKDFAVHFPKDAGSTENLRHFRTTIEGQSTVDCSLVFSPTEVAAHCFNLPMTLNNIGVPSPPPSSAPRTPSVRRRHIVTPRPQIVTVGTPSRRVHGTALRPPLEMSQCKIHFEIYPVEGSPPAAETQTLELRNVSLKEVRWRFVQETPALEGTEDPFFVYPETGVLQPEQSMNVTVTFSPASPGLFSTTVPLVLRDDAPHPFRVLSLSARVRRPHIAFLPARLIFAHVPLDTLTTVSLSLLPSGYARGSSLRVKIEEVALEGGERARPFSVQLPKDGIPPQAPGSCVPLDCTVTFRSMQPLSIVTHIAFLDKDSNRFHVEVCAVADNCLLTLWPYMALHRTDQQVILKIGHQGEDPGQAQLAGDMMLRPCPSRSPAFLSGSPSSTSAICSSTREGTPTNEGEDAASERAAQVTHPRDIPERMRNLGFPSFPPEDSEEGYFSHIVLQTVQNWFSQFGWPRGPHAITVPQSMRNAVCKMPAPNPGSNCRRKTARTIYGMIFHLSGQVLPGVSSSQSVPRGLRERARQLHRQHSTVLDFLGTHGASLAHIRPEYLFEQRDFNRWQSLQAQREGSVAVHINVDVDVFESLSKRAWTDVMLQTYKVLLLPRITEQSLGSPQRCESTEQIPTFSTEPLSSNVYSSGERRVLAWLNINYHSMRARVWSAGARPGDIPPVKWVMNFDLDLADGLVLAALLAAYCPFLIPTHFCRMYTSTNSLEQNLHNSIILSHAFQLLRLDIDILATELSDPNPVQLLMLCLHLYERLPQYLPQRAVTLSGNLHHIFTSQVRLKNPSSRPLVYHASILGREAAHFFLPRGQSVTVPQSKVSRADARSRTRRVGYLDVPVHFSCCSLGPMEAVVLFTSRETPGPLGATMVFSMRTEVNHINPSGFAQCRSPCYQLTETSLKVRNQFGKDTMFGVCLLESRDNLFQTADRQYNVKDLIQRIVSVSQRYRDSVRTGGRERNAVEAEQGLRSDQGAIRQFFCPLKNVWVSTGGLNLEIRYLPFYQGRRYCYVLLLNKEVGDMIYLVEATGDLPLASPLIAQPSPNVRLTNALTGTLPQRAVLCLRCGVGSSLQETVRVPLLNEAWEHALALAAQQDMSPLELERRERTGTLYSSTVRARTASPALGPLQTQVVEYSVETSAPDCFLLPDTVTIPVFGVVGDSQQDEDGQGVWMPVGFRPRVEGRYQCQVVLRSGQDIRVHHVEVIVHREGNPTVVEFAIPAHQSLTQYIPLNSDSVRDCVLRGVLHGWGFSAPIEVDVRAGKRLCYPLTFSPTTKCIVKGRFFIVNVTDGTEHNFAVRGVAERPLPLDHVHIECSVQAVVKRRLQVPNHSHATVHCQVVSGLSIVSGPATLVIKQGCTVPYTISVSPWKRGIYKGEISFVADEEDRQSSPEGQLPADMDSIFTPDRLAADEKVWPYEAWFSLEVVCSPGPPMKVITVRCAAHSSIAVEIPVTNPRAEPLELQVCVEGPDLTGEDRVVIPSLGRLVYLANFCPATVGRKSGSVIFQSEVVGEYWYELDLVADPPVATTLPDCRCELGKWTRISLPLTNPTDEKLELGALSSNTRNFIVELDASQKVVVEPHSTTQVWLRFRPSALGRGSHTTRISFTCTQLGEWNFLLSGTGVSPQLMEALSIASRVGSHSSIIVPFKNPMEHEVLMSVCCTCLSGNAPRNTGEEQSPSTLQPPVLGTSHAVFSIPLRKTQGTFLPPPGPSSFRTRPHPSFRIILAPDASMEVPVVFSPDCLQRHNAWLVIKLEPSAGLGASRVRPESHGDRALIAWAHEVSQAPLTGGDIPRSPRLPTWEDEGPQRVCWVYPIHGIPEAVLPPSRPTTIVCQARSRVETRVEVQLIGSVPGPSAPPADRDQAGGQHRTPAGAGSRLAQDNFLNNICFKNAEDQAQLTRCVALSLLACERHPQSGVVTLAFNVVFSPYKPCRCEAALSVQSITGGLWKFPLLFISTEQLLEDVINIEAAGLNKTSGMTFRLTSPSRCPEPFTARFLPGSAPDFQVFPHSGELHPRGVPGTLFTVNFTPRMYSRRHRATLVIRTADMQWSYEVNGMLPAYTPPFAQSSMARGSGRLRPRSARRRNYLRENLHIPSTAVSSPFKPKGR
ncbi:hypothetical protein AAFF_G00391110 [Aldrovandia affinis]|uniref:Calponin-homology (CH) domain-containing protein n=1 Tax=Aldrovandia affinis TaxID=143900 RepID=A0AAD7SDW4_9TELE|nr:hypothetical protein AAFF_G00391110 [Aldrovandia affinis]